MRIAILSVDYDGTHVEAFKDVQLAKDASALYWHRLCTGHEVDVVPLADWVEMGMRPMSPGQSFAERTSTNQHPDDASLWAKFTIEEIEVFTKPSDWNKGEE